MDAKVAKLKIPQENATIRLKVGELGYAPYVKRSDISYGIALVYGKVRLWDCVNVFAKAFDKDIRFLRNLERRSRKAIKLFYLIN